MNPGHVLRLLATHHIIRECEPDIFALNRVSALLDSGRSFTECRSACAALSSCVSYERANPFYCSPDKKYDAEYGGVAALAALKCVPSRVPHLVVHIPTRSQYRRAFQSIGILYGRSPTISRHQFEAFPSDRSILSEQLHRTNCLGYVHACNKPAHAATSDKSFIWASVPIGTGHIKISSSPRTARHPQAVISPQIIWLY